MSITPTGETLLPDIPWGPIMAAILEVLKYMGILIGIIWGLIGKFKPEFYLVNFNKEGPFNEIKDNHYSHISNNTSAFVNRYADAESRAMIRLAEFRYAGTMINFRNSKGGFWKPGETNWFHNVGICSLAPTYAQSITHLGNPIIIGDLITEPSGVRQVVFQYDKYKQENDTY